MFVVFIGFFQQLPWSCGWEGVFRGLPCLASVPRFLGDSAFSSQTNENVIVFISSWSSCFSVSCFCCCTYHVLYLLFLVRVPCYTPRPCCSLFSLCVRVPSIFNVPFFYRVIALSCFSVNSTWNFAAPLQYFFFNHWLLGMYVKTTFETRHLWTKLILHSAFCTIQKRHLGQHFSHIHSLVSFYEKQGILIVFPDMAWAPCYIPVFQGTHPWTHQGQKL